VSISAAPGATIYPSLDWGVTGLVGTIGVRIYKDSDASIALARATAGIVETPATSGRYVATVVAPTTAGEYTILWDNGAVTVGNTATEDLTVSYSAVAASVPLATDLCTVADVKSAITKTGSDDDVLIQTVITAASAAIENTYARDFAPRTAATYYFKVIGFSVDLNPHDLRSATTVTLDPQGTATVLAATQYRLSPTGAESNLGTYTNVQLSRLQNLYSSSVTNFGYTELGILGDWGPAAVPPDVSRACVITAASWIDRLANDAALSEFGDDGRGVIADSFQSWAIPFGAHRILQNYVRPAGAFA
jgi:hypothetical protein